MVRSSRFLFLGCVCVCVQGLKGQRNFICICNHFYIDKENGVKTLIKLKKSCNSINLRLFHNWLLFYVVALCLSSMDAEWLDLLLAMAPSCLQCNLLLKDNSVSFSRVVVTFTKPEGNSCWFLLLASYSLIPVLL